MAKGMSVNDIRIIELASHVVTVRDAILDGAADLMSYDGGELGADLVVDATFEALVRAWNGLYGLPYDDSSRGALSASQEALVEAVTNNRPAPEQA